MRHIGRTNTGAKCAIIDMMAPKEAVGENKAFIVLTDSLAPRLHDALMSILESVEGQQTERLGFVLNRHLMPDTGETVIQALNNSAKIVAYPTNKVFMVPPQPHQPILLSDLLVQMGRAAPIQQNMDQSWETQKFNPHTNNRNANANENAKAIASNLIMQAEDLENVARQKREEAYATYPPFRESNPQPRVVSKFVPEVAPMQPQFDTKSAIDMAYAPKAPDYFVNDGAGHGRVENVPVQVSNPLEERVNGMEKNLEAMMGMLSKLVMPPPSTETVDEVTVETDAAE